MGGQVARHNEREKLLNLMLALENIYYSQGMKKREVLIGLETSL